MRFAFRPSSGAVSIVLHFGLVAFLFLAGSLEQRRPAVQPHLRSIPLTVYVPHATLDRPGGGAGGKRNDTPASKGRLPTPAREQFVPPTVRVMNQAPKLVMAPTIVMDVVVRIPSDMLVIGDPNGVPGPPSDGPGSRGGIGDGDGTSVGGTRGPGYGRDGYGGVASHVAGRVTQPVLLRKIDPDYSEQARNAKVQGMVLVRLDVDEDGNPANLRVARGLGLGLDEKALEAIQKWKFRPGMRNGHPVMMSALVEVQFRLL